MSIAFRVYRYQLLPLDRNQTKDLYHELTVEEIIDQKNHLFAKALKSLSHMKRGAMIVRVQQYDDLFVINLAPSRPLTRETTDSRVEKVDNWPHISAYILNGSEDQYLLIQDRPTAFANTSVVSNLIKRATRLPLERFGLSLHIEPLFNKTYFWELINRYKNKITWIEFEFITPNMSNISKTLSEALKSLGKNTNAVKEELALTSDPVSSLDISPDDQTIQGLVEYTSEGGGDISLKVKGIRKRFHTSKSTREILLSGVELTAPSHQLLKLIKEVLEE